MVRYIVLLTKTTVIYINTVENRTSAMLTGTVELYLRYIKVKWKGKGRGRGTITFASPVREVYTNNNGTHGGRAPTRFFGKRRLCKQQRNNLHTKAWLLFLSYNGQDISSELISNDNEFIGISIFMLCDKLFSVVQHTFKRVCVQVSLPIQVISKFATWGPIRGTIGQGARAVSVFGVYNTIIYNHVTSNASYGQYQGK